MHDLGTLAPGGNSYAYGANGKGQVVGYASTASGGMDAFLYSNGKMLDLNTLIPNIPGVHLTDAMAISDNGYIVAQGINAMGETTSYLLTLQAVPEPAAVALLAVGIGGVVAWRYLRRGVCGKRPG